MQILACTIFNIYTIMYVSIYSLQLTLRIAINFNFQGTHLLEKNTADLNTLIPIGSQKCSGKSIY